MDARNNIATDLFYKIRSRFTGLKLGTESGEITINPEDARFFDFDYMEGETPIGHVSISLAEPSSMKIYFSHGITENMNTAQKGNWYGFLRELRQFAKRRLLAFDTRDIAKDNLDKRDYEFLSQHSNKPKDQVPNTIQKPVGESVMNESAMYGSRTMSYQKLMDTRLIIKHSQAVMDDTQPGARTRHISALFVENQDGERFKYPFIHLAGARAMQRHVANGGLPYDDIGKSIVRMSEEIAQLKSFGNYVVRNDLMNSENNSIVEKSTSYLNQLRETVSKLSKQGYYEAYKENFQASSNIEVPQEVVEDFVEKFTVRNFKEDIKSVFPVLYRLMQENNALGYDDIVEMTQSQETNEDIEIDETEDQIDPLDQFESWIMQLGEESSITSQDESEKEDAIRNLQKLVGQHFPAGSDGNNAIESLKGIIEDPTLYKDIKDAARQDPDTCVRPLVKQWLEQNAPDVVERLDFGDMTESQDDLTTEARNNGTYELEVDTKVFFERNPEGRPVIQKVMLGNTDITAISDTEEAANYIEDNETSPAPGVDYIGVDIDYKTHGRYMPATWGYHGGEPEEFPEIELTSVIAYGNGTSMEIPLDDLDDKNLEYLQSKAEEQSLEGGNDDYDDYDDRRDMYDSENPEEREVPERTNVQELAEFIKSFYDKESGTFPKGPEGVCTMVGKKFGTQAEQVARKFVERMAPNQSTNQNPELQELARIKQLSGVPTSGMEEDYKSFHEGENLKELRDAIDKNQIVSVAFVKKDGTVRHMAIKKSLSSYKFSDAPKTDKQANVEQNNDLKKVIDINAYNKKLKELKASGIEDESAKAEASKGAWRSINLKTVLGFMAGGKFYDLRAENDIQSQYGEDVYNALTPAMKNALSQTQQASESFIESLESTDNSEVDQLKMLSGISKGIGF